MEKEFLDSVGTRWDSQAGRFEFSNLRSLSWQPDDIGPIAGCIIIERLRTFGGRLPNVRHHRNRFSMGLQAISVDTRFAALVMEDALPELINQNAELIQRRGDVSVLVLASPGISTDSAHLPTIKLHLQPIPFGKLKRWYQHGMTLLKSSISNTSNSNWPLKIKTRNRLHYHLAQLQATQQIADSIPLLPSHHGRVSDTPIANIVVVDKRGECSTPDTDSAHNGTSLAIIDELLTSSGKKLTRREISFEALHSASEILLAGNTGCIWHASSLGDFAYPAKPGPVELDLRARWIQHVDFDWYAQAIELG